MMVEEELNRLYARAADLLERAKKGEITYTSFLTPGEQKKLQDKFSYAKDSLLFAGGYPLAERSRLYFLPDYMQDADESLKKEWLSDVFSESLCVLEVKGSGFVTWSHRDLLGAVLGLGLERSAIGDLCVNEENHSAIVFCGKVIAQFLTENLHQVGRDTVKVSTTVIPESFDGGRKFTAVSDTVASPRVDAIVAALCNLAREKAQTLLREGKVEIDYEPEDKTDRILYEGCVVTIHGYGKFILRSLSDQTKKGRFRLLADRYS